MFELFDTDDDAAQDAPPASPTPAQVRRLPELDPQAADEPAGCYGARVLRFLLATSCTATLDDHALTLADYAAGHANAARNVDPTALAQINELRHVIHIVLKARRAAAAAAQPAHAATEPHRPNEGPMARLTPAPRTQPPGGTHAIPTF